MAHRRRQFKMTEDLEAIDSLSLDGSLFSMDMSYSVLDSLIELTLESLADSKCSHIDHYQKLELNVQACDACGLQTDMIDRWPGNSKPETSRISSLSVSVVSSS